MLNIIVVLFVLVAIHNNVIHESFLIIFEYVHLGLLPGYFGSLTLELFKSIIKVFIEFFFYFVADHRDRFGSVATKFVLN